MMDSRIFLVVLLASAYVSSAPVVSSPEPNPDPTVTGVTSPGTAPIVDATGSTALNVYGSTEASLNTSPVTSTESATTIVIMSTAAATTSETNPAPIETATQITTGQTQPTTPEGKTSPIAGKTTLHTTPAKITGEGTTTESNVTKAPSTQKFDAASFIGGIVLGIVIVAILGFAYSFYKTRRDKNYHTL